jgi:hypothetical protein
MLDGEVRTLEPDPLCVCDHTASQHLGGSGMCLAMDQDRRRGCSCTAWQLVEDEPDSEQVQTEVMTELSAKREIVQTMLLEAAERGLTVEEQEAVVQLAEAIRRLLGETDPP